MHCLLLTENLSPTRNIPTVRKFLVGERFSVNSKQCMADAHSVSLPKCNLNALVLKFELDVERVAVGLLMLSLRPLVVIIEYQPSRLAHNENVINAHGIQIS